MSLTDRVMADARKPYNTCIRCGSNEGVCGRHYNGYRQHTYGKGRGVKCHPFLVADLCQHCDAEFQEGASPKHDWPRRIEYSEEFQHWAIMSLMRRQQEGSIGWIKTK